jgi:magnesium chelatase family protein
VVTVAFEGVEARRVDVEVQLTSGAVHFAVVGLPDKAVAESKERVRAAFSGLGLALPPKRMSPTCRRPISPRRAATTTCRSRSR